MTYVVIGCSAAGCNTIRAIRDIDKENEIILISVDQAIYSRCILHQHVTKELTLEKMDFMEKGFIETNNVKWIKGHAVTFVDIHTKEVVLDSDERISYDKLMIATGAGSKFLDVPGAKEAKNVIGFRSFNDALAIEEKMETATNIVVIGSGFEAVDIVVGLLAYVANVTLVSSEDHILPELLDKHSANAYSNLFEKEGLHQFYNTGVKEYILDDSNNCTKVVLEDGTQIETEYIIDCSGIRPNVQFLENTGIECDEIGLVFDNYGRTNIEDVYGAGDVSGRLPIWPSAVKEALIAGSHMCGKEEDLQDYFISKFSMNYFGLHTVSLGNPNYYDPDCKVIVEEDEEGNYKKAVLKDTKIIGAILQGDVMNTGVLTQLIQREVDISQIKKPLFEIGFADFFRMDDNFVYNNKAVVDI